MRVDVSNFETLKRASEITLTDYNIRWFDAENIEGYIDGEDLLSIIDDLIYEVDRLEEQIEDIKEDIRDNYKPISYAEQVGVRDSDFI